MQTMNWTITQVGTHTVAVRDYGTVEVRMTFLRDERGGYRFRGHVLAEGQPTGGFLADDLFAAQEVADEVVAEMAGEPPVVIATALRRRLGL